MPKIERIAYCQLLMYNDSQMAVDYLCLETVSYISHCISLLPVNPGHGDYKNQLFF